MEAQRERLEHALRSARRPMTAQRERVWEALHAAPGHPTAAEVHARCPELPLATVYNTLELFSELALVRPLALRGTMRYDVDTHEHVNVICTRCGRVRDVPVALPPELPQSVCQQSGYRLSHPRLDWYGVCPPCQGDTA